MSADTVQGADLGKIPRLVFENVIRSRLGAPRSEVLVGPAHGVDAGIVAVGSDTVLAVTADPLFIAPELGWERAGWFAVHIVASDLATSGLAPAYCAIDLNLPLDTTDEDLAAIWAAIHGACEEIGMAVVTGHTGRYEGCSFPTVGGMTAFGVGRRDEYVVPTMAAPGDDVLITKGAAIETTGMLGAVFGDRIASALGPEVAQAAAALFWQMCVVEDARIAAAVGVREAGVTAMHDATERGVWNALCELADASSSGLIVVQEDVPIPPAARAVCDLFDIDPFAASSEGTLLIACRPNRSQAVLSALWDAGIVAARIGQLTPVIEGVRLVRDGREQPLAPPEIDPFWPAYSRALQEIAP